MLTEQGWVQLEKCEEHDCYYHLELSFSSTTGS